MYFLDPLNSLDHSWDCLEFCRDWGNPSWKNALTLSLFSWESQIQGQSKRTGGSWRFHTQICTLRTQVWHVSQRDKEQHVWHFWNRYLRSELEPTWLGLEPGYWLGLILPDPFQTQTRDDVSNSCSIQNFTLKSESTTLFGQDLHLRF